jgi:hypothetical protein
MRTLLSCPRWFGSACVFAALLQSGCSHNQSARNGGAVQERDTRLVHEDCPVSSSGAEQLDANGDGKPDVVRVKDGGREVCRSVDLNFDGVPDSWVYFDSNGKVRRRENDYDRDGRIDEIAIFRGGVLVEKQRATMLADRVDTWEFYQNGKLARSERDSNGDRVVDQWWEYPNADCPVIHADVNDDGRPDPGASVDYCKETGYVPPERQDFKKPESPTFQQGGALPTEVESKEDTTQSGPGGTASAPAAKAKTDASPSAASNVNASAGAGAPASGNGSNGSAAKAPSAGTKAGGK